MWCTQDENLDDSLDDSDSDLEVGDYSGWDADVPDEIKSLYVGMIKNQQEMGVAKFQQLCTYVFKPGTIWAFEYWKLLAKAIRLAKVHGRDLGISRYLAGAEAKLEQIEKSHTAECSNLYEKITYLQGEVSDWEKKQETYTLIDATELAGMREILSTQLEAKIELDHDRSEVEDSKRRLEERKLAFEENVDTLKNDRRLKVLEASNDYQGEILTTQKNATEGSRTAKTALKLASKCGGSLYLDVIFLFFGKFIDRSRCQTAICRWWARKNKEKLLPQVTKMLDRAVQEHRRMLRALRAKEGELCAMRLGLDDAKKFHPDIALIEDLKGQVLKRDSQVHKLNMRVAELTHRVTEAQRARLEADKALELEMETNEERVERELKAIRETMTEAVHDKKAAEGRRNDLQVRSLVPSHPCFSFLFFFTFPFTL